MLKCLWYILKIKIKNPTCFSHSYLTIIRGLQCLCFYYYQCACNILFAYVTVCYLCVCTCGVLARMVFARVSWNFIVWGCVCMRIEPAVYCYRITGENADSLFRSELWKEQLCSVTVLLCSLWYVMWCHCTWTNLISQQVWISWRNKNTAK
jgi:hypothetical protein